MQTKKTPADYNQQTANAMNDPQPGDRFTEMYAFWIYVVARVGDMIVTMEANPPAILPRDGKVKMQTLAEFQKRFSYQTESGYWIRLVDRGNNVEGWI